LLEKHYGNINMTMYCRAHCIVTSA